jgi:isoleucyl-tRNA synthetase
MDSLGADILRLWVAMTDYAGEMTISDEILKRVVESYRRIRNTLRFLLANLADFDVSHDRVAVGEMLEIDQYALVMTRQLQDEVVQHYARYEFHQVAQKLQTFCSEDLGGFYLDILKDRLYTTGERSLARRSAQSALYQIVHALVRLLAPVLSFTSEEVWSYLTGDPEESVFLHQWHELEQPAHAQDLASDWQQLRGLRSDVQKQLEALRAEGAIGAALQAEVTLYAEGPALAFLQKYADDLRFIFITSKVTVVVAAGGEQAQPTSVPGVMAAVAPIQAPKCERCWHWRPDVGQHPEHPGLCGRCYANLFGHGEDRHYA